ncbi:Uncharacterized protein TPAR_08800, partial [Tolypocladium paradoxum]
MSTSTAGNPPTANIAPESSLSSSDNFGSEVRSLLVSHGSNCAAGSTPVVSVATPESLDHQIILGSLSDWPSLEESQELLDLVVLNVGISQQLFDVRLFSDNLLRLYRGSTGQETRSTLWIVKALLIMAVGRLLQARLAPNEVPGQSLFQAAVEFLPGLSILKHHGILGIEVVALCALYLQIADRKEEAYIHASLALRLAIACGMHKASSDQTPSRSEAVHRNRLWWRLAAAGGYPMAIHDEAVTVNPPEDVAGFPSAAAIAMNVRAARITGQITWSCTEASLIGGVQSIFQSLDDLERTMPAEYIMDFEGPQIKVGGIPFTKSNRSTARTSSSLYLSIYQAIIHAGRPILLYMARKRYEAHTDAYSCPGPSLRRLAEVCVEAASRSLLVLHELRNGSIIAKNAFLDLDAVFSVGFVFVLVDVIAPGRDLGAYGIEVSRYILSYLAQLGNRAASRRLAELDQMCAHLGCRPNQPPRESSPTNILSQRFSFERGYEATPVSRRGSMGLGGHSIRHADAEALSGQDVPGHGDLPVDEPPNMSLSDISLAGEDGLFWVFQPGVYTGAELADWEMLENQIFAAGSA